MTSTICLHSEISEQFLVTECFSTCSWWFLRYSKLEQLEFKLEKKYWDLENAGKVRKKTIHYLKNIFVNAGWYLVFSEKKPYPEVSALPQVHELK